MPDNRQLSCATEISPTTTPVKPTTSADPYITARYQVQIGVWAHRTKWFAFLATYTMNTWKSWTVLDVAGIVLHSVPPVIVFLAAETAPWLRDKLTEAVLVAAGQEFTGGTEQPADASTPPVSEDDTAATAVPVRRAPRRKAAPAKPGRKLLADYVADARAMWTPGIEVTPAWARRATGCSRGLSAKVAATLRAEVGDADPFARTREVA